MKLLACDAWRIAVFFACLDYAEEERNINSQ
jgi:hypothetical protein